MPRTSWHLSSDTTSPARARAAARQFLSECGLRSLDDSVAELLVSELVTNAVEHTHLDGAGLDLIMELGADCLRITVADGDPLPPVVGEVDLESDGGRGLHIVQRLATTWGWERQADDGKHVWCELRVAR